LAKVDRMRIVAIAEVSAERREAFAQKWQIPRGYESLESLLETEHPDLICLCTPPGLHREQAVACLDQGLNVLCEKPPALSLADLDLIDAASARGGAHFMTVFQHRFGSGAVNLRQLMGDPRLGEPMLAVCHTLWYRPDAYFAEPWRGTFEHEGGGPTMGHGIHQMDLMLSILGPWTEVSAVATRRARPTKTEDLSCAMVTFASGAIASVVNSLLSPTETSHLRFDFAHGTLELRHLYGYGDRDWTVSPSLAEIWAAMPGGQPSGHAAQYEAIATAFEAGTALPVTLAAARQTMELIAAIYASSHLRRPVRSGEIGPDSPFYHRMDGGFGVAAD
jgi:predicted dehydrogenase